MDHHYPGFSDNSQRLQHPPHPPPPPPLPPPLPPYLPHLYSSQPYQPQTYPLQPYPIQHPPSPLYTPQSFTFQQQPPHPSSPHYLSHPSSPHYLSQPYTSQQQPALARPWSCPRSPNQPMKCPLCSVPLEGGDVTSHFEEEVKQLETLRSQFDDWQSKENNLSDVDDIKKEIHDLPEDSFKRSKLHSDKIPPCTRWQTYQRVKQNRHTRISGMLRTKRYDQKVAMEEACPPSSSSSSSSPSVLSFSSPPASLATTTTTICKPVNRGIWTIVDNHMQTSGS